MINYLFSDQIDIRFRVLPYDKNQRSRTSRDTATPISRPVYMIFRIFNLNPVIDARSR
jgi:hypothetical protein